MHAARPALALLFALSLALAGCVDMPPSAEEPGETDGADGADGTDDGDTSDGGDGTDGTDGDDEPPGTDGGSGAAEGPLAGSLEATLSQGGDTVLLAWTVTANWPGIEALELGFSFSRDVAVQGEPSAGPMPLERGASTTHELSFPRMAEGAPLLVYAWASAPVFEASRVGAQSVQEITWDGSELVIEAATWPPQGQGSIVVSFDDRGADALLELTLTTAEDAPASRLYVQAVSGGAEVALDHEDAADEGRTLAWTGAVGPDGTTVVVPLRFDGSGQAQLALNFMPDPSVDLAQYGKQLVFEVDNGTATLTSESPPPGGEDGGSAGTVGMANESNASANGTDEDP